MALDANPGSPTFNSYCTVAAATTFLEERLYTQAWYTAPPDVTLQAQREAALITATLLINTYVVWSQPPSTWTSVPLTVQRATAYYALDLLDEGAGTAGATTGQQIRRKQLGETTIEYYQTVATAETPLPPSHALPADIAALLVPYGVVPPPPDPDVKYAEIRVF